MEEHKLVLEKHDGGGQGHSTITAKIVLKSSPHECLHTNKFIVIKSTDLTAAFTTVNHWILVGKLELLWIMGKTVVANEILLGEQTSICGDRD